jgi:hypothetical protein
MSTLRSHNGYHFARVRPIRSGSEWVGLPFESAAASTWAQ